MSDILGPDLIGDLAQAPDQSPCVQWLAEESYPDSVVFTAGYIGEPWMVATNSDPHRPDPVVVRGDSMFGHLRRTCRINLVTLQHGGDRKTQDYLNRILLDRLTLINEGRGKGKGYTILVGLSFGAKRLSDWLQWHDKLPRNEQLPRVAFLMVSPAPSAAALWPKVRLLVKTIGGLRVPRSIGGPFMRSIGRWVLVDGPTLKSLPKEKEWIGDLMHKSASRSSWVIETLRGLAASSGFGPQLGTPVPTRVALVPEDEVVNNAAARRILLRTYPNAQFVDLPVLRHGTPEVDGAVYAKMVADFLSHLLQGLSYSAL